MTFITEESEIQTLGRKTKMGYLIETSPVDNNITKFNLHPCTYKDNPVLGMHHKEITFECEMYLFKSNLKTVIRIERKYPMEIGYIAFLDFNYASVYSPFIPGYGHKLICNLYFDKIQDQMLRVKRNIYSFYFPGYNSSDPSYVKWRNSLLRFINIYNLDPDDYRY